MTWMLQTSLVRTNNHSDIRLLQQKGALTSPFLLTRILGLFPSSMSVSFPRFFTAANNLCLQAVTSTHPTRADRILKIPTPTEPNKMLSTLICLVHRSCVRDSQAPFIVALIIGIPSRPTRSAFRMIINGLIHSSYICHCGSGVGFTTWIIVRRQCICNWPARVCCSISDDPCVHSFLNHGWGKLASPHLLSNSSTICIWGSACRTIAILLENPAFVCAFLFRLIHGFPDQIIVTSLGWKNAEG